MKDIIKVNENKVNCDKVGKVLLKDEYGKTGPEIIEKQYALLSVMETFERRFQYKSIVKAYEISKNNKKHKLILSQLESKRNNKISFEPNKLLLTKIKYTPISNNRNNSAIKLFNKINFYDIQNKNKNNINYTTKLGKTLSQDNLFIFKDKTFQKNFIPFIINSHKNKDIKNKTKNKRIIRFPSNNKQVNFTNSINLRMDFLKKNEKENKLKKYFSLKDYNDKYSTNNKEGKSLNSKDSPEEEDIEKDPFKEIKNNFEYGKIIEQLKDKYKFYPYSYLEEHKDIEPNKFKFMVNNFNTKFSLFGKYNNILDDEKTCKKSHKKINYNINFKPSTKIMEKIIKKQKLEKMNIL